MMMTEAVLNVFEVSSNLVCSRLQTLAKVVNNLCDWLLRKFVPDFLQCGLKLSNH